MLKFLYSFNVSEDRNNTVTSGTIDIGSLPLEKTRWMKEIHTVRVTNLKTEDGPDLFMRFRRSKG